MPLENEQNNNRKTETKRYKIQYPVSTYKFPKDALIDHVRFDKEYLHVNLTDGRILSIPLDWIPSLYNASPEDRAKYEINRSRTMIIWDPDKCAINEEVRIADYLGQGETYLEKKQHLQPERMASVLE